MNPPRTLILMRHAEADPSGQGGGDLGRTLSLRGRDQAQKVAAALRDVPLDYALRSHALRTRETLDPILMARPKSLPPPLRVEPLIYSTCAEGLLDLILRIDDAIRSVILVGHNPAIDDLLTRLLKAESRRILGSVRPATCVLLHHIGPWVELGNERLDTLRNLTPPE